MDEQRPNAAPREEAVASEREPVRILVIDDEEGMREGMRRVLERRAFSVQTARDGETAIRMLGEIDAAARALPGRDCGSCGAPTCASFAEDLVVGRAGASDCPHRTRPLGGAAARRRLSP